MASERVDKSWQQRALSSYSTAALLATLQHYGVSVDEAAVKSLAEQNFPLELADAWHPSWRGTGQFSRYHWAAAEELWRRFNPERLAPADFAKAIAELIGALTRLLKNDAAAPVGAAFKKLDELRSKIPVVEGKPARAFVGEVMIRLGEAAEAFRRMSLELAKAGHAEDAAEFAALEEFLVPEWAGISSALARAASGQRDEGIHTLDAIARENSREPGSRLAAIDSLIQLEAFDAARPVAELLLDHAEKASDFHLALETGERAMFILQKLADRPALRALDDRLQGLQQAHATAHPDH